MPKKQPPLTCEFIVEDIDNIPIRLENLSEAIELALNGNGAALADLVLSDEIIELVPKEALIEIIRNTKKSKRPIITKFTASEPKPIRHQDKTLSFRKISISRQKGTVSEPIGRPINANNAKRNNEIYHEYKKQIKVAPKWQCLRTISSKYNLSESTIEDILKLESTLNNDGWADLGNGKFTAKRWWIYGKPKPEMGEK